MVSEIPDNCRLAVDAERIQDGGQQSDDDIDSLKLDLDGDSSNTLQQVDIVSVASSYEDDSYCYDNSLALNGSAENAPPSFGNIAVSNSSGIHVGNKNYYQGPVTIKKIVYAGAGSAGNGEIDAYGKQNDVHGGANGKCDKGNVDNVVSNARDKKNEKDKFAAHIRKLRQNKPLLIAVCICVSTLAVIGMGLLLFVFLVDTATSYTGVSKEQPSRPTTTTPIDPAELPPQTLKLITRREWLAQAPSTPPDELTLPVPYIVIWHSATDNCTDQATCAFMVKQIQNFHMKGQRWWDIAYNFLVGGDGYVYEGRGWNSEGSHTKFYNKQSIGIAFVGTFNNYMPPKRQLDAARNLISLGVNESYVQPDYKLFAARQLSSTESPGDRLYEELMTWPHWTKKPDTILT